MDFDQNLYENQNFDNQVVDMAELTGCKFVKCSFRGTDFSDLSTIYRCTFDNCQLSAARLNGVTFNSCGFLSCKFKGATFFATTLRDCKMTGSDFADADCGMLTVEGGDLSYVNLRNQSFSKHHFDGVRFCGADLSGCRFRDCTISECDFAEAIVQNTSFFGSDLRGSSLGRLNLRGVDLKNARLDVEQCVTIAEFFTEARCQV